MLSRYRHVSTEAAPTKFYRRRKKDKPRNTVGKTASKPRKIKQCRRAAAWEEQAARITPVVHLWHPQCRREKGPNGLGDAVQLSAAQSLPGPSTGHSIDATKRSEEHTGISSCSKCTFLVLCLIRFPEVSRSSHF